MSYTPNLSANLGNTSEEYIYETLNSHSVVSNFSFFGAKISNPLVLNNKKAKVKSLDSWSNINLLTKKVVQKNIDTERNDNSEKIKLNFDKTKDIMKHLINTDALNENITIVTFYDEELAVLPIKNFISTLLNDDPKAEVLLYLVDLLPNLDDKPYVVTKLNEIFGATEAGYYAEILNDEIYIYQFKTVYYKSRELQTVKISVTRTETIWIKKTKTVYEKKTLWITQKTKVIKYKKVRQTRLVFLRKGRIVIRKLVVYYSLVPVVQWKITKKQVVKTVKHQLTYWEKITTTVTSTITKTVVKIVTKTKKVKDYKYKIYVDTSKNDKLKATVINLSDNSETEIATWLINLFNPSSNSLVDILLDILQKAVNSAIGFFTLVVNFITKWIQNFVQFYIDDFLNNLYSAALNLIEELDKNNQSPEGGVGSSPPNYIGIFTNSNWDRRYIVERYRKIFHLIESYSEYDFVRANKKYYLPDSWRMLLARHHIALETGLTLNYAKWKLKCYSELGIKTDVIIPLTTEVLVYDPANNEFGWTNLKDYTIYKAGDRIEVGVSRTTYLILTEDNNGNLKFNAVVDINLQGNDQRLLNPILKRGVERYINNLDNYDQTRYNDAINDMLTRMLERIGYSKGEIRNLDIEKVTWGDIREKINKKYGVDVNTNIAIALENMGINVRDDKGNIRLDNRGNIDLSKSSVYQDTAVVARSEIKINDICTEQNLFITYTDVNRFSYSFVRLSSEEQRPDNFYHQGSLLYRELTGRDNWAGPKVLEFYIDSNLGLEVRPQFERAIKLTKYFHEQSPTISMDMMYRYILPTIEYTDPVTKIKITGIYDLYLNKIRQSQIIAVGNTDPVSLVYFDFLLKRIIDEYTIIDKTLGKLERDLRIRSARLVEASILHAYTRCLLLGEDPTKIEFVVDPEKGEKVTLEDLFISIPEINRWGRRSWRRLTDEITIGEDTTRIKIGELITIILGFKVDMTRDTIVTLDGDIDNTFMHTNPKDSAILNECADVAVKTNYLTRKTIDDVLINPIEDFKVKTGEVIDTHTLKIRATNIGDKTGNDPTRLFLRIIKELRPPRGTRAMNAVRNKINRKWIQLSEYSALLYEINSKISEITDEIKEAENSGDSKRVKDLQKLLESFKEQKIMVKKALKKEFEPYPDGDENTNEKINAMQRILTSPNRIIELLKTSKQIGKSAFVVAIVLPIIADVVFRGVFSLAKTVLDSNESLFASFTNSTFATAAGICITILTVLVFNMDFPEKLARGLISPQMIFGFFLVALGDFLKIFGAPFYMGEELITKIGEMIGTVLGKWAEQLWDSVAGYVIPVVNMTVFDLVINALFIRESLLIQLIVMALANLISRVINQFLGPIIQNTYIWLLEHPPEFSFEIDSCGSGGNYKPLIT